MHNQIAMHTATVSESMNPCLCNKHGVVLQGRALLHGKRGVPIHSCQPRYGLAIPDESMIAQSYPRKRLKSGGRCVAVRGDGFKSKCCNTTVKFVAGKKKDRLGPLAIQNEEKYAVACWAFHHRLFLGI